jgi:hypothetical protein
MAHLLKITVAFEFSVLTLTVPGLSFRKIQNPCKSAVLRPDRKTPVCICRILK